MQLYKISFTSTDKQYIGISSVSAAKRFKTHCNPNNKSVIACAIRKHEGTTLTILAEYDDWDELCKMEMAAIAEHNTKSPSGYNIVDGGRGATGRIVSVEERERRRLYYLNNPTARYEHSIRSKKQFSSKEARQAQSERTKAYQGTIEARKINSERAKIRLENPKYKAKLISMGKAACETPEARQAASERVKAYYNNNPEARLAVAERMKVFQNTPEARKANSERAKKQFSTLIAKQRQSEKTKKYHISLIPGEHSAKQKESFSRPEIKAKRETPLARAKYKLALALRWAKQQKRQFSYIDKQTT